MQKKCIHTHYEVKIANDNAELYENIMSVIVIIDFSSILVHSV